MKKYLQSFTKGVIALAIASSALLGTGTLVHANGTVDHKTSMTQINPASLANSNLYIIGSKSFDLIPYDKKVIKSKANWKIGLTQINIKNGYAYKGNKKLTMSSTKLNIKKSGVKFKNGKAYYEGKPFTGILMVDVGNYKDELFGGAFYYTTCYKGLITKAGYQP